MATIKVANTPKDACSESEAELYGTIAELKPSEPGDTTRKEMNSGLTKRPDQLSQDHSILSKTFLPP